MPVPPPPIGIGKSPVQTIAVTGGKGGVGKSNIAANLAAALSMADHEVLLVDGNLELGSIDKLLGLSPRYNLQDVYAGACSLQDAQLQGPAGISVIPSARGMSEMARLSQINHASLIALFSELPTHADTLVVDTAPGLSESVLSFCQAVREVLVVLVDEPAALNDAFTTIRVLHEKRQVRRFRVVSNQTESAKQGLDLYDSLTRLTERHLDVLLDYCGSIPFDPHLKQAVCQQRPVVEVFPRSPAAMAFRKLSMKVARWPQPQTPCGHIEFFVERLIQADLRTR